MLLNRSHIRSLDFSHRHRVENVETGEVLVPEFFTEIPADRAEQIKCTGKLIFLYLSSLVCAETLKDEPVKEFPFVNGAGPVGSDIVQLLTNRTWQPALSTTGVDGSPPIPLEFPILCCAGIPTLEKAGNVLRTHTSLTFSVRVPPTGSVCFLHLFFSR